ncbi:hypothetical protein BU15DRAFT_81293 [Melanogaster broomeanus]|nr:hypothetical protein BU15DRAFT_81293 [Melanogaster broomeanus]
MDSEMHDAHPTSPSSTRRGRHEPSRPRDGCGRHRSPSADHGSRGQKWPRSEESDHNHRRHRGWVFEPQTGVITHPSDCTHCEAYHHHYMDAAFSVDSTLRNATAQRELTGLSNTNWEELVLSRRGERRSGGLERRIDELEGENQALREDLDTADARLAEERAWGARSDQTIDSLEQRCELAAAREPPRDRGFPSFPQRGRGRGSYHSNFPSYQSQEGQGSGVHTTAGNAVAGPSNSRERPALPLEQLQATPRDQRVRPQEKVPEARHSAPGPTTMETLSRPKPTKIIRRYTAEWSEDEPNSEDADNDVSPPTAMRSVGDSVVLTIDKRDVAFSGEAAKQAQSAYQKGHIAPISQGVRHFGDSASPLMIHDVDRLFANVREGRAKAISQVQRYRHMLATAFEKRTPLSDAQLYGLAQWRAFNNQPTGPSMRPEQVLGATNPSPATRASASGGTAPSGGRAPKIAQPTYNDPHQHGRNGCECMTALVLGYWSMRAPTTGNSGTRQHFTQQSALLLMMPRQYRAITEKFNISIAAVCAIGPMQNFGPNSSMIDIARAMAYRGVTWTEADDMCLYGRTLAQHLLTGDAPLLDNIRRALQEYEIRVLSADLAVWYVEELPSGMAPTLSRVGPALVEAFGTPSGTVIRTTTWRAPPAPPEMGTIGTDTGNTPTTSGPLVAEPMVVELGELIQSVEPELAQEGEGVKGA